MIFKIQKFVQNDQNAAQNLAVVDHVDLLAIVADLVQMVLEALMVLPAALVPKAAKDALSNEKLRPVDSGRGLALLEKMGWKKGQGLGRGKLAGGEKICFLHLDAHTDVFTTVDHFLGAEKSAAHWGAYTADQGLIDPAGSMQIGLRGHPRTLDWLQPSYDYGYNVVTMADYRRRGAADVIAQARDVLAGRPVYITFDLDCLDPSVAPAVSNIEPGVTGFSMDEAVELLHAARGLNIIGGDVVCMMPTKDSPNNITAMVGAAVMFEMISMMAENLTS